MKERTDSLREMVEAVRDFHRQHGFEVGSENIQTMHYRMNLLMEELGEICQALTKGKGKDQIAEEHADLFILLLGNCLTMNIDLIEEFWKKMAQIAERKARQVGNCRRVSDWGNSEREEEDANSCS